MNFKELSIFLAKAKQNTYASSGEGGEEVLADGAKEFYFKENSFYYRDRYYGYNPFSGQEVVFYNKKSIWTMNYYGKVLSDKISPKEIYNFLKTALSKVDKNKPFRGACDLINDNFEYKNKAKGNLAEFSGREEIYYKKNLVYKLDYHGGLIN
ncbi:MAG: DUF5680 domain-containing protein [Patescibacteria group bacterium]|nr:DUF5680 domain-containing protein [Patescibacteria group bacterium]